MSISSDHRRANAALLQQTIGEVLRDSLGRPIDETMSALEGAIAAKGLQPAPAKWLEAVARDASVGHLYVESTQALNDSGVDKPEHAEGNTAG